MKVEIMGNAPVVYIEEGVMKDIKTIVKLCDKEVAWVGLVEKVEDVKKPLGDFLVYKVFLPKQKVSGTECEYDAEDMARIAVECGDAQEDVSRMRLWGHSHAGMAVFASAQDQTELLERKSWLIQQITNKKGEIMHRLWLPEQKLLVSDIEMVVIEDDAEREMAWKAEIKERVEEKKYGMNKGGYDGMKMVEQGVWVRDDGNAQGKGKKGKKDRWNDGWVWSKRQQKFQPMEVVAREEAEAEDEERLAKAKGNGNRQLALPAATVVGNGGVVRELRDADWESDERFEAWYNRHYGQVGGEG